MSEGPITLCIDVGGTNIKAVCCDREARLLAVPATRPTPRPAQPDGVLAAIAAVAQRCAGFDRVAVGFPAVVENGVTTAAANLDEGWARFPLAQRLADLCGKPVRAANDADVQGLGAVSGEGVEMLLTLGTGVGSALFLDGRLIPNLELGHMVYRDDRTVEEELGRAALLRVGREAWLKRVPGVLVTFDRLFNYDRLYIGGGHAIHLKAITLPVNAMLVRNDAGLTGGVALWEGIPRGRPVPLL